MFIFKCLLISFLALRLVLQFFKGFEKNSKYFKVTQRSFLSLMEDFLTQGVATLQ